MRRAIEHLDGRAQQHLAKLVEPVAEFDGRQPRLEERGDELWHRGVRDLVRLVGRQLAGGEVGEQRLQRSQYLVEVVKVVCKGVERANGERERMSDDMMGVGEGLRAARRAEGGRIKRCVGR